MYLSNGYTSDTVHSITRNTGVSCSTFHRETKIKKRLLVTSFANNDKVLSYRHKSENLLLKEIEGMYPGEPAMNKFLKYYVKKNFNQLFDLFDKAYSAFDNIYFSQTQQSIANDDASGKSDCCHDNYFSPRNTNNLNEETRYRVCFNQKQKCDDILENDISYTKEEISDVMKQALMQTLIGFHKHSQSNESIDGRLDEVLMAHYLTLPSTSEQKLNPLLKTFHFSMPVTKHILKDILTKYYQVNIIFEGLVDCCGLSRTASGQIEKVIVH